jgi:hypothetical protein
VVARFIMASALVVTVVIAPSVPSTPLRLRQPPSRDNPRPPPMHLPGFGAPHVLQRWAKLYEGFQSSPQEFYAAVEAALEHRQMPQVVVSRIWRPESYPLTTQREYLRVERKNLAYDICGAPFGNGFFFSYRLLGPGELSWPVLLILLPFVLFSLLCYFSFEMAVLVMGRRGGPYFAADEEFSIPWVGPILLRIFPPPGYYEEDVSAMFRVSVERAVMEAIEALTNVQGLRATIEQDPPRVQRVG